MELKKSVLSLNIPTREKSGKEVTAREFSQNEIVEHTHTHTQETRKIKHVLHCTPDFISPCLFPLIKHYVILKPSASHKNK